MKKLLIPLLCLIHMAAISWWTLPNSFGGMAIADVGQDDWEAKLFKAVMLDDNGLASRFFRTYIDVTGSQQYWDFFAPDSPRYHQYLSVCESVDADAEQEKIACRGKPWFSTLEDDYGAFKAFVGHDSRLYRLGENLAKLQDPVLMESFTRYYWKLRRRKIYPAESPEVKLVLHLFELHPELKDLPKSGYRMDRILWTNR